MLKGTVTKSTGSWYDVKTEDGKTYRSRIIGKFRLKGKKITNPVAVGDQVAIEIEDNEEDTGLIKSIFPRENYVIRQSPRKKHEMHLLASNVDQAIVIMTIKQPKLKIGFIDRFLLMTEPYEIPTIIVFNKADIYDEEDDLPIFGGLQAIYNEIGYEVLLVSAITGEGIEELKAVLKDKTTLIAGQSGVGKSSLIRSALGDQSIKVGPLSETTRKGTHTTTTARLFHLPKGGKLVDSPGIREFGLWHIDEHELLEGFIEFRPFLGLCKFRDCQHKQEPGCAILEAHEKGDISDRRMQSYERIKATLGDIETFNA